MNRWNVIVMPEAESETHAIYEYISKTLLSPEVAIKQVNRLLEGIRSLEEMPLRYPLCAKEPWHSQGIRSEQVDKYLIFYLPNEKQNTVAVLHVLYGGRNLDALIAETTVLPDDKTV